MATKPEIIQTPSREAWLAARKNGIGSSEIATIVGANPYETKYELWQRKTGRKAPAEETFAMRAGHYLEDAVSRFFADETGLEIIKASASDILIRDPERPFLQVSPDRLYWLKDKPRSIKNRGIVECKTTRRRVDKDSIPPYWYCQLQYQMGVSGWHTGHLAWLSYGSEFGQCEVDFNADFFRWLAEEAQKFWERNVKTETPPEIDPGNLAELNARYAVALSMKTKTADDATAAAVTTLVEAKAKIKELEAEAEQAEAAVKAYMGTASQLLTIDGEALVTWKNRAAGARLDTKRLKAEEPAIAAKYTVEGTPARVFQVCVNNG